MARRRIPFGWLIAAALLVAAPAGGQFPGQNIPPTRVPFETPEPPLAPRDKAGSVPEKLEPSLIGSAPRGVAPGPLAAAPVTPDPPTPSVSIHVSAPATASAGADIEYKIVVENKSQAPAHHVKVTFPIPDGGQILRAEPPAVAEPTPKLVAWKLDTLKPGESRTIRVSVLPAKDGLETLNATARVQFEHGQTVRTVLHRPQLAVRKITNQHALENESISCRLIVENTGAVEVVNIKVDELLNEGLEFIENGKPSDKPNRHWDIASLAPKQKQEFTYALRATKSGALSSKVEVRAERGALATHDWKINIGPSPLTVKMTGPKQVYLNYPAQYDIQVDYAGSTPLDNVIVAFTLPKGMKVVRVTPAARGFEDRLQWALPRLAPMESRRFTVSALMNTAGTVPNFVQILWRGPTQHAETTTEFLGAAALHLDVRESQDPVRVGDKVRYVLSVTNRGTAPAKDVKLLVSFPVSQFALDVDGSDGKSSPTKVQEIVLPALAPKATLTRTVTLKAVGPGTAIVHVEMESSELTSGNVTREESTTITQ